MGYFYSDEELAHHGILGQKWGVRRFENKDGTLTPAGRSRYDTDSNGNYKKVSSNRKTEETKPTMKERFSDPRVKKAAIIGAAAVGTALVAYGGYKLAKSGAIQKAAANTKFKTAEVQKSKAASMAKNAAKAERLGMDAGKQMAKADKLAESAKKTAQEASKMKSPVLKEQYKKIGVDYGKALKETERAAKNLADKKQADIAKKTVKTVSEGFQSSSPAKFEFEKFMPEKFDFDKFEYESNELVDGLLKKNARMLGL